MFVRAVRVRSFFTLGIIVLFVLLGAGLTTVFSGEAGLRAYDTSNLVRLRFVANSDSAEDQEVKRKVRDAVLEGSRAWITAAANGEEMRDLIESHQSSMLEDAKRAVADLGRDDAVRMTWGMLPYTADPKDPVRLPSGRYLTLQVIIGEGAGHNWWCLLFPALCFGSETGIQPVLPAGDRPAAQDEVDVKGQAGPAIYWALAGMSNPVQASGNTEGAPDLATPLLDAPAADAGEVEEVGQGESSRVGDWELRPRPYTGEGSLDRVWLNADLFR